MANKFQFKIEDYKSRRGFGEKPFFRVKRFFPRLKQSIHMLNLIEKIVAIFLLVGAIAMSFVEGQKIYYDSTKPMPAYGGSYREGIVGGIKYINPVLASTDNDKSITALIFSGLVKYDAENNVVPDIAKSWQISNENKTYTFNLKDNVYFHNGRKLSASDVVYTINRIKELEEKSPLYDAWSEVNASAPTDSQVVFELSKPYGPFIYNCGFGVLPADVSDDELNKKPIGTGKLKFVSVKKEKNEIKEVELIRNDSFYDEKPLIKNVEFISIAGDISAENDLLTRNKIDALVTDKSLNNFKNIYFKQSKKLGLVLNTKDDKLKDKALRQKILSGQRFESPLQLSLDTIDADLQRSKAEGIKKEFAKQNIVLNINYHNSVAMLDVLSQKKYQLLLYGFDFGRDGDPYLFWHSSQIGKLNFANWMNKDTDIALEDARMITDKDQRQAKYDEFYKLIENEFVAKFYDVPASSFTINNKVKGIGNTLGSDITSRYNNFEDWYVKEKRAKK